MRTVISRFAQVLEQSPVRARVAQVRATLASLSQEQREAADATPPGEVMTRVVTVMDWAHALLVGVDPRLLSPTMLDAADLPIQQIETALNTYLEGADEAQLTSIDNACGEVAATLASWPGSGPFSRPAIQRIAGAFGSAAEGQLATVRRGAEEAASEIESRFGPLSSQLEAMGNSVTEAQQTMGQRQDELESQLTTLQEQAGGLVTSTENSLTQIRSEQEARFDVLFRAIEERSESSATEHRDRFDALEQALNNRARDLVDALEAQSDQARRLLDVVATSATAGAFGSEADDQKREADRWRVHATRTAIAAAAIGLLSVLSGIFFDASPTLIITKVALTAVVAGIAGYAAGQSAQHRKREVRARRLFLELTAFGPFAEPLSDEDRAAVRREFIARLFVGDPQSPDGEGALTQENISLLSQLANVLQRGV